MNKRGRLVLCSIFEISLLIIMSFAIAVIWGDSIDVVDALTKGNLIEYKGEDLKIEEVIDDNTVKSGGKTYTFGTEGWKLKTVIPSEDTVVKPLTVIPNENPFGGHRISVEGRTYIYSKDNKLFEVKDGSYTLIKDEREIKEVEKIIGENTKKTETGKGKRFLEGHLAGGISYAITAYSLVSLIGGMTSWEQEQTNAYSTAVASGVLTFRWTQGIIENVLKRGEWGAKQTVIGAKRLGYTNQQFVGGVAGIVVGVIVLWQTYKKPGEDIVYFKCKVWQPPVGGEDCEKCNDNEFFPCSEYRCRSLGQACELVNVGTEEEKCVWINPKDVNSPTIEPWYEVLKPKELEYSNVNLRPPSLGMKIIRGGEGGCLKAYEPLEFGLATNEPAYCKVSYTHTNNFEDMEYDFGGSNYYLYNHTHKMLLPSPNSEDYELGPVLQNDGTFTLFVRCQDKNGNSNVDEFAINFCVDPSPDTTAPQIVETSIPSGAPVQHDVGEVLIGLFVNEPAECKWSRNDRVYDEMENIMECKNNPTQIDADLRYVCRDNLTSIKNMEENKFYFRCKDQPDKNESDRNVNVQSYELILRGSQPLNIVDFGPNETISGNTDAVVVGLEIQTDDGANEGEALCYFSETGEEGTYIQMFETGTHMHSQDLDLGEGEYEYYYRCVDAGGNSAEASVEFEVEVDRDAPDVTNIYREDGLKVVTNEDAECVYSLNDCNYVFEEGLPMIYSNPSIKTSHFAEWRPGVVYYIKCRDEFDNRPSPNSCSIEVSAVELS